MILLLFDLWQGTGLIRYSAYPFPNRKERTLDDFEVKAWDQLNKNPDSIFSATEESHSGTIVRVGIADLMVNEVCIGCHNSHPDTPKSDWKLNDVRGILEVQMNIEEQISNGVPIGFTIILVILALSEILSLLMFLFILGLLVQD